LYSIVTYSYLILPLAFVLFRCKFKDRIPATIALYGLFVFSFLMIYEELPKGEITKYAQSAYTFLEYAFFSYIFWYNLRNKSIKSLILILSGMFIIFQITFVISTAHRRLDSIPIGIETILVFLYIFYFFYEFSKQIKDTFIYNHYTFWIAVGILIYLGGSFFFFILVNELDRKQRDDFGTLTYVAEIIKNLLFGFSIFMYKKFSANRIHNLSKNIPNLDMI